jgi:glycerol-3-phosphate acyltransferase PlsY
VLGPALTLGSYLVGSISFGLLIAKHRGVDLREVGSGNVGATNVGRALGKKTGRAVLALDAAKGIAPALIARLALGPDDPWTAAVGTAAVVGHCFPIWHRLRGGKGAATAVGVLLVLSPPAGIAGAATYFAVKKATGRASAGSIAGALVGAGTTLALHGPASPRTWMAGGLLGIVLARHAKNIVRLIDGTEPRS